MIRDGTAGQSALPPATGTNKKTADEIVAAFAKDPAAATAQFEGKPVRITGKVVGFNDDYALNRDGDLFIVVGSDAAPKLYVRFSRPQFDAFILPADKKPKGSDPKVPIVGQIDQTHTKAYFSNDLNCIALFASIGVTPPAPAAAAGKPAVKPNPVYHSFDKIPLVSIGDTFDADTQFEQFAENTVIIFNATVVPPAPPTPATPAASAPATSAKK